ncbi:MAG: nitroreductase family protein [Thiobacillus sp.]|nr:nitroreductase family protein [Thiobacillus sp.]
MMVVPAATMRAILARARWAPSADNTQPWRFRILDENACHIDYQPQAGMGVFNLDHYTGHLALGGLLETLKLAAGAEGFGTAVQIQSGPDCLGLDVQLIPGAGNSSPLEAVIENRSTQRRLMKTRPLPDETRRSIEADLPPGYRILWLGQPAERRRIATLLSRVGKVRLLMPETYEVHRDTVEWGARYSVDRIPSDAIGADPLTRRIMAWALRSPARVNRLNRMLGHWLPRLEMDYLPALACGAHFFLVADSAGDAPYVRLRHGAAMQRLWLSVTRHGLQFQPEMAALVFARYLRAGTPFTEHRSMAGLMAETADHFSRLLGDRDWRCTVFMGRVGYGSEIPARSLRHPLDSLLVSMQ